MEIKDIVPGIFVEESSNGEYFFHIITVGVAQCTYRAYNRADKKLTDEEGEQEWKLTTKTVKRYKLSLHRPFNHPEDLDEEVSVFDIY